MLEMQLMQKSISPESHKQNGGIFYCAECFARLKSLNQEVSVNAPGSPDRAPAPTAPGAPSASASSSSSARDSAPKADAKFQPYLGAASTAKLGGSAGGGESEGKKEVKDAAPEIKIEVFYAYDMLKRKDGFPPSVNVAAKELYLSPADFQKTFGMDKGAFAKMPKWKQANMKQKVGLF